MCIYIILYNMFYIIQICSHTRIRGLLLTQSCSMYDMLEDASDPHGCAVPTCRHSVRAAPCGCHSRSLVWTNSADPRCPSWKISTDPMAGVIFPPIHRVQPVKKHLGPQVLNWRSYPHAAPMIFSKNWPPSENRPDHVWSCMIHMFASKTKHHQPDYKVRMLTYVNQPFPHLFSNRTALPAGIQK